MSEWKDIGEQLRKARESMDLELVDVTHSTRIPLATLRALEESDYSIFPSPTYAKSFLSQYSDFLNIDAREWVDAFQTGDVLSSDNDHSYLNTSNDHLGRKDAEPAQGARNSQSPHDEEKLIISSSSLLQNLTVFSITALLIGGGIYAYKKYEPMFSEQDDSNTSQEAMMTEDQKVIFPPSEKLPPATPATPQGNPPSTQTTVIELEPETLPEEPALPDPLSSPPPKAMVIEESNE